MRALGAHSGANRLCLVVRVRFANPFLIRKAEKRPPILPNPPVRRMDLKVNFWRPKHMEPQLYVDRGGESRLDRVGLLRNSRQLKLDRLCR